jgi:hypothetical protein
MTRVERAAGSVAGGVVRRRRSADRPVPDGRTSCSVAR